jgi:transposase
MTRFPTAGHLVSWAKFAPGVKESAGKKKGNGSTGHGNRYLARTLGETAIGLSRTDTFLGERDRRIARRRGSRKAIASAPTSARSKPSATKSPSNPQPDHKRHTPPAPLRSAPLAAARHLTHRFSD